MAARFIFILISVALNSFGQPDSVTLPSPSGSYAVGTVTYEWTDTSRVLPVAGNPDEKRTIIVQLWYPAIKDRMSVRAPYSPLSVDYKKVSANSHLRAPFNETVELANLILISPGRGTERYLYTTIAEELTSHGYVVASVDMPEIGYVYYSDGLVIKPSSEFKPPRGLMGGPYEKVDEFFERPTAIGVRDLSFALDKLRQLDSNDPNNRFNGRINFESIGIFGHSLGGRIAGAFTESNPTVKAYISMEGIPPRIIRYQGKIDIPIAMLCSSGTWPYAQENYYSLINNRSNTVFMIELPGFGHNSVTDNPLIYPEQFKYSIDPLKGLEVTRSMTLSYFNERLRQIGNFEEYLRNATEIVWLKHEK
jgi:dienelactone hydrolase